MSRDDWETGDRLLNPFIEIGLGLGSTIFERANLNASTLEDCLGYLKPTRDINGPFVSTEVCQGERVYSVWGVVAHVPSNITGMSYVNIGEEPISRTLMGYLPESVLKEKLPTAYKSLLGVEKSKTRIS